MANAMFKLYKVAAFSGGANVDLLTEDVRVMLIDTDEYSVDLAADEFVSDIPSDARIAASAALTTKTFTSNAFHSDPAAFTGVTGAQSEAFVIYVHTGNVATDRLVAYIDSATGLPFLPNGGGMTLTKNAAGWFQA